MSDEQFERVKAKLLEQSAFNEWVTVEEGGVFEGTWEQVDECFGLDKETFERWCEFNGYKFNVDTIGVS